MSLLFQLMLLALFSCIGLTHAAQKYFTVDGITKCESKSSKLNECVLSNAKLVWPRLINGVKDFDIPPIDPFIIKKFMDFSYQGVILIGKFVAPHVKVVGLANLLFKSVDVKVSNNKITLKGKVTLPKLRITGNYSGRVKVPMLSVAPRGSFNLLLEDLDVETKVSADVSSRDGHTFAKLTELNVEPKVGKLHLDVNELVINSVISKAVMDRVNKEWHVYYDSVMPKTRTFWQPYIVDLINKLLDVTPIEDIIDL